MKRIIVTKIIETIFAKTKISINDFLQSVMLNRSQLKKATLKLQATAEKLPEKVTWRNRNAKKLNIILILAVCAIFLTGCEGAKPKQRPAQNQQTNTAENNKTEKQNNNEQKNTEKNTEPKKIEPIKTEPAKKQPQKTEPQKTETKKTETPKNETVVKAEVGAGAKGHYGGEKSVMAPILVPLGTYWRASEMTTYNIKIPKAMQMYKANHENKAPATHEEFMEEIIKKEMIKLPQLPPGHKYIYDPADEQLKIAKPK
ncbi:MAG: hypothetical protein LBP59_11745 [Planctomycetaceae bacterium]|jgi:hypothetical protein|nr:hypothetical protein [Planctomycetaceae bacterium]